MTRRILITGATSGIGHQLVIDYLDAGYDVYAVGRNQKVLTQLQQQGAKTICVELTNRVATIQAIQTGLAQKPLDLVICCAGMCHYIDIEEQDNGLKFDSETLMQVINGNLGTLAYTIEAVLPALQQSKGRLVALGSASAFVPFVRAEAYASSKSAVHYLMKTLQMSLKPHGINVSLVIPGFVDTPMTAQNDFDMPLLQTVAQASRAIRKGIDNGEEVIEFPKRLTLPLKTLGILPDGVWHRVSDKLYK